MPTCPNPTFEGTTTKGEIQPDTWGPPQLTPPSRYACVARSSGFPVPFSAGAAYFAPPSGDPGI